MGRPRVPPLVEVGWDVGLAPVALVAWCPMRSPRGRASSGTGGRIGFGRFEWVQPQGNRVLLARERPVRN